VASSPADVVVSAGESSLHVKTPRGELVLTLPAGVNYEQGSCVPTPAGEFSDEELHFRLRIGVSRHPDEGNVRRDASQTPATSLLLSAKARTKSFASYLELDFYLEFNWIESLHHPRL